MRILGIDPGLRVTGFGVIDKVGHQLHYVASGCIKTPVGELPERLKSILNSLGEVIAQHNPEQVAVEKVFVNVNPQSTLLLGQARGAAICAASSWRVMITPRRRRRRRAPPTRRRPTIRRCGRGGRSRRNRR